MESGFGGNTGPENFGQKYAGLPFVNGAKLGDEEAIMFDAKDLLKNREDNKSSIANYISNDYNLVKTT